MTEIKIAGYLQGYLPKTAGLKATLKKMWSPYDDWPLLPAVRPMYTEAEVVLGPEDHNVIYMPDGRTEWQGDSLEETPYATADSFYRDKDGLPIDLTDRDGEMDGVKTAEHGLPEGYEYLATDGYGDPLLRDPEGNLVTMFHETGDLRKVKTQLKIRPLKKKQATGKTGRP